MILNEIIFAYYIFIYKHFEQSPKFKIIRPLLLFIIIIFIIANHELRHNSFSLSLSIILNFLNIK